MKYFYHFCVLGIFFFTTVPVAAQFEQIQIVPDTPDHTDALGSGGSPIYFSDGTIGIVYKIQTDYSANDFGPDRLFLVTSSDDGTSWSESIEIDSSTDHQGIGGISAGASGNRAIISYFNADSGWKMIYSDDNGSTWSTVSNSPDLGNLGSINQGLNGSFLATYQASAANGDAQWVVTSTDGLTWSTPQKVIDNASLCGASIAQTGETDILLIYHDCFFQTGELRPVMQIKSTDSGATWSDPSEAFQSETSFGTRAAVALAPDNTVWILHTNNEDLYYTTSTDGGATWEESTQWTDNSGMGNNPGDFDQDFAPQLTFVGELPFALFLARRGNDWFHLYYGVPGVSVDPLVAALIEQLSSEIPSAIQLEQNYPNPFRDQTRIRFSLRRPEYVTLRIYNSLGQEIARPAEGMLNAASYEVSWVASNLPSGMYYFTLHAGTHMETRSLLLIK